MKRPAVSSAAGVQKKQATGSKCKSIETALISADGFSTSTLNMLAADVALSLGVYKDERHPYQDQICTMIGQVLEGEETAAKAAIASAEAATNEVRERKAGLESSAESQKAELATQAEAESAAKKALDEAAEQLKTKQAAHAEALTQQEKCDAECCAKTQAANKVKTALASVFVPLKEGSVPAEDSANTIKELVKSCKDFNVDPELIAAWPHALRKGPASRSSFEKLVIADVEAELAKEIAALDEALPGFEASKADCTARTATAASEVAAAVDQVSRCKDELKSAKAVHDEADAKTKAAVKALKDIEPETKLAEKSLFSANAKLANLTQGPLAAYAELLEHCKPVAEEPAAAAEAEPAAAAEAETAAAAEAETAAAAEA